MTKTFLFLLLSLTLLVSGSFGQIPKIVENPENLERGREIIKKARRYVFGQKIDISKIKKISYSLKGESVQEKAATISGTSTSQSYTRNFSVEDRISFELPYKLELTMKAKVFDGDDTEIVHHANKGRVFSTPDTTKASEIMKNPTFISSLPSFNLFSDINGMRTWTFVFPILLHNFHGKAEEQTTYIYVGTAVSPEGKAELVAVLNPSPYRPMLYFDSKSHQLIKMTMEIGGGQMEIFPDNYKEIKGFRVPKVINLKETIEIQDKNFGIDKKTVTIRETALSDFSIQ